MIIIAIEKLKGRAREYSILLDTGQEFSVHEDTMVEYRLLKGKELSQQLYEQIVAGEQLHKAYMSALQYLSRRAHASGEIQRKLQRRGYEVETIDVVIAKLKQQGYIDDQQMAQMWVQERIEFGKKGRNLIQYEMQQKGFSSAEIAEAFRHVEEDAELAGAYALLCKRIAHTKGDLKDRQRKISQYLLRRGFTHTTVRQAWRKWKIEQEHHEYQEHEEPPFL